jgi:hypothetical protein
MTVTQPPEQRESIKEQAEILDALIGEQVMHALGAPPHLHKLQVRRLWADHYRVNVFVGDNAATAKVANSYFVKADGDGNIVEAHPKICKQF